MSYLDHLRGVAVDDVDALVRAEKHYGDSWMKRGGVGAFMMLARKWDRLEKALAPWADKPLDDAQGRPVPAWDIFAAAEADKRPEGIIDDIRDLRRYLLLVESELRARAIKHEEVKKG